MLSLLSNFCNIWIYSRVITCVIKHRRLQMAEAAVGSSSCWKFQHLTKWLSYRWRFQSGLNHRLSSRNCLTITSKFSQCSKYILMLFKEWLALCMQLQGSQWVNRRWHLKGDKLSVSLFQDISTGKVKFYVSMGFIVFIEHKGYLS